MVNYLFQNHCDFTPERLSRARSAASSYPKCTLPWVGVEPGTNTQNPENESECTRPVKVVLDREPKYYPAADFADTHRLRTASTADGKSQPPNRVCPASLPQLIHRKPTLSGKVRTRGREQFVRKSLMRLRLDGKPISILFRSLCHGDRGSHDFRRRSATPRNHEYDKSIGLRNHFAE